MSFVFSYDRRRMSLCCQGRSFSLVQRDRWRRKFNPPEIIAAKKFEGQAHILAAARNLPIDYPRPDAPAAFWIYDIYFVSNFETVMTSEGTAMLAQEDCFCGIIIDIATWLLPPQHERYPSCNPSTSPSPATGCGSHVDLNSRSSRIPSASATDFLPPATDTLRGEWAAATGERNSRFFDM